MITMTMNLMPLLKQKKLNFIVSEYVTYASLWSTEFSGIGNPVRFTKLAFLMLWTDWTVAKRSRRWKNQRPLSYHAAAQSKCRFDVPLTFRPMIYSCPKRSLWSANWRRILTIVFESWTSIVLLRGSKTLAEYGVRGTVIRFTGEFRFPVPLPHCWLYRHSFCTRSLEISIYRITIRKFATMWSRHYE